MVMVDLGVSLAEAMALLRAHAFTLGRPLGDVARDVVAGRLRLEPYRLSRSCRLRRTQRHWEEPEGRPSTMIATEALAALFVEVADTLVVDFDIVDFLHMVTTRTADITRADAAGLVLADAHNRLQFMAASTESAKMLELFQLQAQEGPCRDCFRFGAPVINTDLSRAAGRWPRSRRRRSRPDTARCMPSRCGTATTSSAP